MGRQPIQTSAVIMLGVRQGPAHLPPSPPTPCASPPNGVSSAEGPTGSFSLEDSSLRHIADEPQLAAPAPPRRHETLHDGAATEGRLRQGIHVLRTEALALANLSRLYESNSTAQEGFDTAVRVIVRRGLSGGKVVIVGVGKSGHIGRKLVATMQSVDVRAVFLHPTEALHGDLGLIDPRADTLLFITHSGKTQELMLLLPHLDKALPTILLTSHIRRDTCELIKRRPSTILLPAPIPESEATSFGASLPTSSTTVALALGDALAVTAAKEMHHNMAATFAKNHPGGAIGAATKRSQTTLKSICVPLEDIPSLEELGLTWKSPSLDLLRAGVDNQTGWIRAQRERVVPPARIREISTAELQMPLAQLPNLFLPLHDTLAMSSDTPVRQAGDMVRPARQSGVGEAGLPCRREDVVAVTEGGKIIGVLEARRLFE